MDNALLSCSTKSWQFSHPGDGSIFPHEYKFVRGAGIAQDDPRLERFDATSLSPVNVSIGTRAVGAICHGLETFRAINSQQQLRREDALFLGRACALTVTEETTKVLIDLKSDIASEIRSVLSVALKSLVDFIEEISEYARNQQLRIGILEMVRAAFLKSRAKRSAPSALPPAKFDDSFSWSDYRSAGARLNGTRSIQQNDEGETIEGSITDAGGAESHLQEEKSALEHVKGDNDGNVLRERGGEERSRSRRLPTSEDRKEEGEGDDELLLGLSTEAVEALLGSLQDLKTQIEIVENETPQDVIEGMKSSFRCR